MIYCCTLWCVTCIIPWEMRLLRWSSNTRDVNCALVELMWIIRLNIRIMIYLFTRMFTRMSCFLLYLLKCLVFFVIYQNVLFSSLFTRMSCFLLYLPECLVFFFIYRNVLFSSVFTRMFTRMSCFLHIHVLYWKIYMMLQVYQDLCCMKWTLGESWSAIIQYLCGYTGALLIDTFLQVIIS